MKEEKNNSSTSWVLLTELILCHSTCCGSETEEIQMDMERNTKALQREIQMDKEINTKVLRREIQVNMERKRCKEKYKWIWREIQMDVDLLISRRTVGDGSLRLPPTKQT